VLGKIREELNLATLPVVIVTSHTHLITARVHEQANYILHKPIDVAGFVQFFKRLHVPQVRSAIAPSLQSDNADSHHASINVSV
jgi:UDP-N-acetylglucosamine pyrophosphorylase